MTPARFPIIIGPTAGGKSDVAVELALLLSERLGAGAEIVTADSIQIYRGLDIGSAKPTTAERRGVSHHLIDVVEPTERFSVDVWLGLAEEAIGAIRARGGVPVVVGGTHLYVKALLDGLFRGPEPDPALRAALEAMPAPQRRAELERVDPAAAARIHPNDVRRTVRALEVYRLTGRPISAHQVQWDAPEGGGIGGREGRLFGLQWPAAALNARINARVKGMMERGLLGEVRGLVEGGRLGPQAGEALGYKQLAAHIRGECSLEEAVEKIKIETRRFAKNQRTWIRRLGITPESVWIAAEGRTPLEVAQVIAEQVFSSAVAGGEAGAGGGGP